MPAPNNEPVCILGIRAEPRAVHWAVVEGTQRAPIVKGHDRAAAPASYEEPAALSWFRERVLHLIDRFHPTAVGVRFPEAIGIGGARNSARERSRVEGVVLEAAHARGLRVLTGSLATIAAKLGTKKAKKYVESNEFRGVDLTALPAPRREAVLIAIAQLPRDAIDAGQSA
jgi:hypothetical protein